MTPRNKILSNFLLFILLVLFGRINGSAQVPSLINYQGRLADANGAPVTGSKNFVIRLYDAQTGGALLYAEDLGSVSLGTNGIYSFQFGSAGSSNTLTSETVATTNGSSTTFQKVLSSSPVVAGSVSVSDGTYTWSEASGSSDEENFGVSYSSSLRRVTVTYYSGPPASGRNITATYRSVTTGISGALAGVGEHWMELSVDGTTQGTRQRVLAVPFASLASRATFASFVDESSLTVPTATLSRLIDEVAFSGVDSSFYQTEEFPSGPLGRNGMIEATSLEMVWDDPSDSITTRALGRSKTHVGTFDVTWPLSGPVQNVSMSASFVTIRTAMRMQFIYLDGSISEEIGLASASNQFIANPNPEKVVKDLRVRGFYTIGHGSDTFGYSFTPTYHTQNSRSFTMQISNSNSSLFGLRVMINGVASGGKILSNCLRWRVMFLDGSESNSSVIGSEILWPNGKIPKAVKVFTVPELLGVDSVDVSRVVIRLITKD